MKIPIRTALAVSGVCTLIAACGSSASSSNQGVAPISEAAAGNAYLADIAPVHTATAAFEVAATEWSITTTRAQAAGDAAPLIGAEQTFNAKLTSTAWPTNAKADIDTLVKENSVIIGDLQQLQVISRAGITAWDVDIRKDTAVDISDSALVRSDLDLPPAST
jgi:hypothetical protein